MCTSITITPPEAAKPRVTKHNRQRHPLIIAARRLEICYARLNRYQPRSRSASLQARAGESMNRYLRIERQLHRALRCSYHLAARVLMQRCSTYLRDLEHQIYSHQRHCQLPLPVPPTLKSFHQELLAAADEFGDVEFDARENVLAVTTDPIVLEDLDLGRFRIELHIAAMTTDSTSDWYRIEAVDPNPAASDEEVTHPHVQSSRLCAGDASDSIHDTLISGRLSEFFLIVRSVLETYNSQSPYVPIEDWSGRSCYDCDDLVSSDDSRHCERCSRDFCDNCASWCYGCNQTSCLNCLRESEVSEHLYCENCCSACSSCEATCGEEELTESLCPSCFAMLQEEDHDEHPAGDPQPTTTPNQENHPHGPPNPPKPPPPEPPESTESTESTEPPGPEEHPAPEYVQTGRTHTDIERSQRSQAQPIPCAIEQASTEGEQAQILTCVQKV